MKIEVRPENRIELTQEISLTVLGQAGDFEEMIKRNMVAGASKLIRKKVEWNTVEKPLINSRLYKGAFYVFSPSEVTQLINEVERLTAEKYNKIKGLDV